MDLQSDMVRITVGSRWYEREGQVQNRTTVEELPLKLPSLPRPPPPLPFIWQVVLPLANGVDDIQPGAFTANDD